MSGFDPSTALLASAAPVASRGLLIAVIALLALVIIGLAAMALVLRRRTRASPSEQAAPDLPSAPVLPPVVPRRVRPAVVRGGGGGGLAVATSSAMVCPTCRTEYHGLAYCTRDARRLIPPEEMLTAGMGPARGSGRSAGLVCMACRRAYEPGLRSCPHDGNELVPFPVYNATRPRRPKTSDPAGVIARICPVCNSKYDLNARFCGHDAGELVVIN
ncbi:MAG: hypothetical protein AB7P03_25520 [Kofleriaceae bacterium]